MRFKLNQFMDLRGLVLIMLGGAATVWLAATKQLNLYIHPRYILFSVLLGVIGLSLSAWSFRVDAAHPDDSAKSLWGIAGSLLILGAAAASLLVFKPTVLSSAIANQRGLNTSVSPSTTATIPNPRTVQLFANNDYSQLTIKEWASLLSQTSDSAFFAGKKAHFSGFITAPEANADNVFFVSRFVVSCCAVDAQPIGVPVYLPGWRNKFRTDQWVDAQGSFIANPSPSTGQHVVLEASHIKPIAQPKDPYVY